MREMTGLLAKDAALGRPYPLIAAWKLPRCLSKGQTLEILMVL